MPEENEVVEFRRLIFSSGKVLNNCECGFYDNALWCYLRDIELPQVFQYFLNPDDFNMVIFEFGTTALYRKITYTGFTELKNINVVNKQTVDVCITGPDIKEEREDVVSDGIRPENQN